MAAVPTFTKTGTKATAAATLDKTVFGVLPTSHTLLKEAYVAYLANGRQNLAVVKNRGDVSGGGKKPWRQKGTGRARVGSSRVPQWRHGGVVFGPTGEENYSFNLPTGMKRSALRQALSLAAQDGRIRVIEAFESKDGKVAAATELLAKIEAKGSVLIALDAKDELVERATRNLPKVKLIDARYLTVYDLLNADTVVLNKKALDIVTNWLKPAKATAKEGK